MRPMFPRNRWNLKNSLTAWLLAWLCATLATPTVAAESDIQQAAAALLKATVTVRIIPARAPKLNVAADRSSEQAEKPADFFVSSGVSLGGGRILTFSQLPAPVSGENKPATTQNAKTNSSSIKSSLKKSGETKSDESKTIATKPPKSEAGKTEYRVTLSDGEQALAQPRVIDQYSGLVLLEIQRKDLPGLKVASGLPAIGGSVLSASAAGIEKPLVSLGILSGFDRTLPGASLPPMLQCDISTTEASSGAALIDGKQQLIGIIAATEATNQQFGWSFAIGFQHVRRVLAAQVPERLIVLARQRAVVGLKLGPGPQEGTVIVEHVVAGGPADLAGIRQGEMVLEAEGRKIRSAYQAVAIILKRMPGDVMTFVLGTEKRQRTVRVRLGGGGTVPATPESPEDSPYQVGPQVQIRVVGPNRYEMSNRRRVSELSVDANANGQTQRKPVSETELLSRQLQAYQDLIVVLQKERLERQTQEREQLELLDSLRKELKALKQQQQSSPTSK